MSVASTCFLPTISASKVVHEKIRQLEICFFVFFYRCAVHSDIQGVSGGICITLGNDSMSDSKQKSSYEHGSDFERLRSYGHFLIPVHALM